MLILNLFFSLTGSNGSWNGNESNMGGGQNNQNGQNNDSSSKMSDGSSSNNSGSSNPMNVMMNMSGNGELTFTFYIAFKKLQNFLSEETMDELSEENMIIMLHQCMAVAKTFLSILKSSDRE